MLKLTLGWPVSVNLYWRRVGFRFYITHKGQQYRDKVKRIVASKRILEPYRGRLEVRVYAYPPDQRRRDLDNIFKNLLDSLQHAGVYEDDSQIDRLSIERMNSELKNFIEVEIIPL